MKIPILILIATVCLGGCKPKDEEMDILIKNGMVYDGLNKDPQLVSIAIKEDTIAYIGNQDEVKFSAKTIIDATGLIVAPGFIDPHTHADRDLKNSKESHNKPFLYQGITTVVVGNDGSSPYPISKYANLYREHGIGTNVVFLVGQGTIREQVIGKVDRQPNHDELERMKALLQQEMQSGAFGMSTGLFYAPGSYATTEEIIELGKVVATFHGIYDTHLRDEGTYSIGLATSVKEAIEIGKESGMSVHISHIKCLGKKVWKQSDSIIQIIDNAIKSGLEVTASQYPYLASATGLQAAVVPRWAESGGKDSLFIRYEDANQRSWILDETQQNIELRGGPEKLLIVNAGQKDFVGKTIKELSESMGLPPNETVFEVLKKGYARVASFSMDPYDVENFMKQEWVVTASDGNTGHPRKYGTFPRKYKYYVKGGAIKLADFINRSSSKTAQIFRIKKRGSLVLGNYADIIIFDPETFGDKADYEDAFQLSEGLKFSIINGKMTIDNGTFTENLNGRILKKNDYENKSQF
ncbi:N-acyl-D-amino-acid deacylase family protein [Allomuricauda sp. M10]|uniref:N-acyl-D-amino-acid deacylase family protein n=1 Tax=Allomuricauda sp. M10 TaxID=2683292 RepID=UPI001D187209|nr:amidohydrolase family protein [Muricauda sp. M10]